MPIYTSNANGIYSTKWVNSTYYGPTFTIRRSSDSVTSDFYMSADGASMGTTLGGGGTSLSSWLNGATAYVTKWYDQSSAGKHATQNTASQQPTIDVTTMSVNFIAANKCCLALPDGTVPYGDTAYTVIVKHGVLVTTQSNNGFLGSGNPGGGAQNNSFGLSNNTIYINYWWSNDLTSGTYAANNTVSWKYDRSSRYVYINGTQVGSMGGTGRNSTSVNNYIGLGDTANQNYANGRIYGIAVYNTALSDANRLASENSIGSSAVSTANLLCYYDFETVNGSNQILNNNTNSYDMSLDVGNLNTVSVSSAIAKVGTKSLYNSNATYDSSSNYYNTTLSLTNLANNISASLWFYNVTPYDGYDQLLAIWATGGGSPFYLCLSSNSYLRFGTYAVDLQTMGITVTQNVWHHFVVTATYNGSQSTLKVYYDGAPVNILQSESASYTYNNPLFASTTLDKFYLMGSRVGGSSNSYIDEVALFSRVLSAADVTNLYNLKYDFQKYFLGSAPSVFSVTPQLNSLSVAFSASTGGNPAPAYFYSTDGNALSGSGVVSSPITISNLNVAQIYTFYIVAVNFAGKIASASFTGTPLIIGSVPAIGTVTPQLNSLQVAFTQSSVGNPAPTYYYSTDGTTLSGSGVASSPITISNLNVAQSYTFYIVASSDAGKISSASFTGTPLIIGSAPIIGTVTPQLNQLQVAFTQLSVGNPAPTYYYSTDGTTLSGPGVASSPITIPATLAQSYTFYIVASSTAGKISSASFAGTPLIIGSSPLIGTVTPQLNQLQVAFTQSSVGNPAPTYYYSTDGTTLSGSGVASSPITIPATLAQSYTFYIVASSTAGKIESTSFSGTPLIVATTPPSITGITPGANSLVVAFTPASGGNPSEYTYTYSINGGDSYNSVTNLSGSTFTLTGLANRLYTVFMKATNTAGTTSASNSLSMTPYYAATTVPQITGITPGPNSLVVAFTPASGGNPSEYAYTYSINGGDSYNSVTNLSGSTFTLTGLANRSYTVFMKATNSGGTTLASTSSSMTPYYAATTAPQITGITPGPNSLVVAFNAPLNGNPSSYTYTYSINGGDSYNSVTNLSGSTFTLTGLANRSYTVFMKATNSGGTTSASTSSSMTPYYAATTAPQITGITPGPNSLVVAFNEPLNGNPSEYTYTYSINGGDSYNPVTNLSGSTFTLTGLANRSYTVTMKATNSGGTTLASTSSTMTPYYIATTPPQITGIVAGTNNLTVSFNPPSGGNPSSYTYTYSLNNWDSSNNATVLPGNTFVISELANQSYTVRMKATNTAGTTETSNAYSMSPNVIGNPPTNVVATSVFNGIKVTFVGSANSNPAPTYYYSLDSGSYTYAAGPTDSSFTVGGLTTVGTRTIGLRGTNSAGNTSTVTVSGEPWIIGSNPRINSVTSAYQSLIVDFSGSTGGYPAPTYYYSLNGGVSYAQIANVVGNTFTINDLSSAILYTITMKATNSAGDTGTSNGIAGTPLVIGTTPRINSVDSSYNSLVVSFSGSTGGYPSPPVYYYSLNGGVSYAQIANVVGNTFTIKELSSAIFYPVTMKATNLAGDTVASNPVSGKPWVIGSRLIITSVNSAKNSLQVGFTDSAGGYPAPFAYYYSVNSGALINTTPVGSVITVTDLSLAQLYTVNLVAQNTAGYTQPSLSSIGEPWIIGSNPRINSVTSAYQSLIVDFSGSTGGYPAPTYYYSLNGGGTYTQITNLSGSTFTISNLTTVGNRAVIMKATNSAGDTGASNSLSGQPWIAGAAPSISSIDSSFNGLILTYSPSVNGYPSNPIYSYSIDNGATYYPATVLSGSTLFVPLFVAGLYSVVIKGTTLAGDTAASTAVSGRPYIIGSPPVITNISNEVNRLAVFFNGTADGYPAPTYYSYSVNEGGTYTQITNLSGSTFNIDITTPGTYTVIMKATNLVGDTGVSNSFAGTPNIVLPPNIISVNGVTGVPRAINVFFNPPYNGSTVDPTTYYYSLDNGPYIDASTFFSPITIRNLANTVTQHSVKLIANYTAGNTAASSTAYGTPYIIAQPPHINSVTSVLSGLIVDFSGSSWGYPDPIGYYYSLDGGDTYVPIDDLEAEPFVIDGLSELSTYSVTMISTNLAGDTAASNSVTGQPYVAASAPFIRDVSSIVNGLVVKYNRSVGGYPTLTKYYYSLDGANYFEAPIANPLTDTEFTITGLSEPAIYQVTLFSVSTDKWSSVVSNSVVGRPYVAGNAPEIVKYATSFYSVDVYFKNNGAYPEPTAYFYSVDGGGNWEPANVYGYFFQISELKNNAGHVVTVKSVNLVGESPASIGISMTTTSLAAFYVGSMNPSYNRKTPIFVGPQPKYTDLSVSTNQTKFSLATKYSKYVKGTAGSRR